MNHAAVSTHPAFDIASPTTPAFVVVSSKQIRTAIASLNTRSTGAIASPLSMGFAADATVDHPLIGIVEETIALGFSCDGFVYRPATGDEDPDVVFSNPRRSSTLSNPYRVRVIVRPGRPWVITNIAKHR